MFTTVIRTAILYVLVITAMRMMGKRQIADMQPTELVVTLLISEIAAIPIQDSSQPVLSAVVAIFTLTAFEIILALLSLKSSLINNLTNGKSAVIIKNGRILQHRLKKLRITVADLVEMLRVQGIFDINEVSYAILETNGNLSVLQKLAYRNARYIDVKEIAEENDGCPILVVSDGTILNRGIKDLETSRKNILETIEKEGYKLENILLMTLNSLGETVIIEKEKND